MHLLEWNRDGDFSLTKDLIDNIPPHAILSHTWTVDGDDEVTFKDIVKHIGKNKASYAKLRFCGEQTASDSLQYF